MDALLWQRFLAVVVGLPLQLLQIKQSLNFIYYIGLKLVCAVKDGYLRETYIAGSATFSMTFPGNILRD